MSDDEKKSDAAAVKAAANLFLNPPWLLHMHLYTKVVLGLDYQEEPPRQPGMHTKNRHGDPLLTVPELKQRVQENARKWEPLIGDVLDTARPIKEYATLGISTLQELGESLSEATWEKLSEPERRKFQARYAPMFEDMVKAAEDSHASAIALRKRMLAYRDLLEADHDESQDVQLKYKDWIHEQDALLEAWEKAHGLEPGDSTKLVEALQRDVEAAKTKWIGLSTGSAGAAGGTLTVFAVTFPPVGFIAGLIAMAVMAALAEEFRKEMAKFEGQLAQVKKYNQVKLFFSTMDKTLTALAAACESAAEALGQIASLWTLVISDLKSVQGRTVGLDGLAGTRPWDGPSALRKALGATATLKELIADCNRFVECGYVNEVKIIDASKKQTVA